MCLSKDDLRETCVDELFSVLAVEGVTDFTGDKML